MIDDKYERFATGQAVTTQAVSTNSYHLTALRDVARGRAVKVRHACTVTAGTGAGATHMDFEIVQADNAALSSGLAVVDTLRVAIADLVAGWDQVVAIPKNQLTKLYIGVRFTPVGGAFNAGAYDSHLIDGDPDHP